MMDGYYLSTYLWIDDESLRENASRRQMNMSLWKKDDKRVELVHYWELDKLMVSGKRGLSFSSREEALSLIEELLDDVGMSIDDINDIWGTPGLSSYDEYSSIDRHYFVTYHSLCHLFSAMLYNTDIFKNEEILSLAMGEEPDGLLDYWSRYRYYYAGCYSKTGSLEKVFNISSPQPIWTFACEHFKMSEEELIDLALASKSELFDFQVRWLFISDITNTEEVVEQFNNLFYYTEDLREEDAGEVFNYFDDRFTERENKISMAMKWILRYSYTMVEKNIESVIRRHRLKPEEIYLAISGKTALNNRINSYIMTKYGFKGLIAPSWADDSGQSLGMALDIFANDIGYEDMDFVLDNHHVSNVRLDMGELFRENGRYIESIQRVDASNIADDIVKAPIIVYNTRQAIGSRGLGSSNILFNPTDVSVKEDINARLNKPWWKSAEAYLLDEKIDDLISCKSRIYNNLHNYDVVEEKYNDLGSVLNSDGTINALLIEKDESNRLYNILKEFNENYDIPLIGGAELGFISIQDVITFAISNDISVMYIDDFRIELRFT